MAKQKYNKRKDGLYETTRVDKRTGKRIHFYAKSIREMDRKLFEYQGEVEKGRAFDVITEEWAEEHWKKISYNTIKHYNKPKERLIDFFGGTPIKTITPKEIERFLKGLSAKEFSQKIISSHKLVANLVFSYAVLNGDLETNPVTCVPTPKGKPKQFRELPPEEDIEKVKTNIHLPYGLLHFFILYTGCRRGEALAMQFKDIDVDNETISITKSLVHTTNGYFIKSPKTEKGVRSVPLLTPLKQVLIKGDPEDFLFYDNAPPTNASFERGLKKYRKETGISCTPHQLRHAYATILYEAGIDEKAAQELLGHTSIQMTRDVYTHISTKRSKAIAVQLNNFLKEESLEL